jgi:molybdenum cofactor cytidylyltransferase
MIESDWFFITMGDMPEIDKEIFRKLIIIRDENKGKYDIIRPMYHGKRGHPVLLHRSTITSILNEPDSSAMKHVFFSHRVLDISMNISSTFMDIDTPEDYRITKEE